MLLAEFGFWFAVGVLVYTYVGFSALVVVMAGFKKRHVRKKEIQPSVTLIVAAWNEEKVIGDRIQNALEMDYPAEQLQIIIASDGSDDQTVEIATSYDDKRVSVLDLPRRGKILALQDAMAEANGEIIIFSDANSMFKTDAITKLVANFADPDVGGVCGNQLYVTSDDFESSNLGENMYWNFDKWLKKMESLTGSIVSADGAIYAIRKELFEMPESISTTDDFALSTAVVVKGYRLVYENDACAMEAPMAASDKEFRRKVRVINRGLMGVLMRKKLLNPFKYGFYAIELFSHKVLRRAIPIFLVLIFALSVSLRNESSFYLIALAAQSALYLLAGLGYLFRSHQIGKNKLLYIPFFYCLANAAAFVAIVRVLAGKSYERWQPQRN